MKKRSISQYPLLGFYAPVKPVNGFYAYIDNKQVGPLSETETEKLIKKHFIQKDTLIWTPGSPQWVKAEEIPILNKYLLLSSPGKKEETFNAQRLVIKDARKDDLIVALRQLGYKMNSIKDVVDIVLEENPNENLGVLIKVALARLSNNITAGK